MRRNPRFPTRIVLPLVVALACGRFVFAGASTALEAAGANRPELERALAQVPAEQRESMEWLLAHMPPQDAATLSADFLLTPSIMPTRPGRAHRGARR